MDSEGLQEKEVTEKSLKQQEAKEVPLGRTSSDSWRPSEETGESGIRRER